MPSYEIHARDPDGSFHEARWSTPQLPSIGENVFLPGRPGGYWQEMTVELIGHHPDRIEVWLGGSDNWGDGTVAELFDAARQYVSRVGSRAFAELEAAIDLAKALRQLVNAEPRYSGAFWVTARNARATLRRHQHLTGVDGEMDP